MLDPQLGRVLGQSRAAHLPNLHSAPGRSTDLPWPCTNPAAQQGSGDTSAHAQPASTDKLDELLYG